MVHPLTLLMFRGTLYVIVELLEPAERLPSRIQFAAHRMKDKAVHTTQRRPYPADFNAETLRAWAFEIVTGDVCRVVLEVGAVHVAYLFEHYWHPTARLEPVENGDSGTQLHLDVARRGSSLEEARRAA